MGESRNTRCSVLPNGPAVNVRISHVRAFANAHRYTWDEVNARNLLARIHRDRHETAAARAEFARTSLRRAT